MKRLFVFGCSYTHYAWPTWGDFLGIEYDYFENWAISGLGNRAIAERVTEANARHNFGPDDTVIVQWSTYLRHDFYHELSLPQRNPGWKTYGSLFNYHNIKLYDQKWMETFFYEPAYLMHGLNYIHMTQHHLDGTGCTWYMTSIGDWQKMGTDMPDGEGHGENLRPGKQITIWEEFPQLAFYEKPIFIDYKDKWLEPIGTYVSEHYKDQYWKFRAPHDKEAWMEFHPSVRQHANWLNEVLRPKLELGDIPKVQTKWVDSIEEFKTRCYNRDELSEILARMNEQLHYWPENATWPGPYVGF